MIVHLRNGRLAELANAYENELYGKDFAVRLSDIDTWLASPMFFWSICSNVPIPSKIEDVLGSLSIMYISSRSADDLLAGRLRESDLRPWKPTNGEIPVLYFCSYSGSVGGAGRRQFALAEDYFCGLNGLVVERPTSAVSIAATFEGERHLEQAGFTATGSAYIGKYPMYRADCGNSRVLSKLWSTLLGKVTAMPRNPIEVGGDRLLHFARRDRLASAGEGRVPRAA
jgi:hypothetical protein